jgi:uncharacterized repeat protein (TIGR03803 family)
MKMTNTKAVLSKIAHSREKSFLTSVAVILVTLILVGAAATTAATAQTYTVLYNFGSNQGDPNDPYYSGIIAQGRDGNLYSTAPDTWTGEPGTVFKITPAGVVTVLHQFNGTDGQSPSSGLTLATGGNFYGTTQSGGSSGNGTIFRITCKGKLTTLYNFKGGKDGSLPYAPPIQGLGGNLYGTSAGGNGNNGSVYKITQSGSFTTLHSFDGTHGANPYAPLVQAADGNFYGTTTFGGTSGNGTIFRISASGKFVVLFNFDGTHGGHPSAPLIQASDGNFYGVAATGGVGACASSPWCGVVFKITPTGVLTVLHNFNGGSDDGQNEVGGLVQATDGNFYGTNDIGGLGGFAAGVLFRITPTGTFTVLHNFFWDTGGSAQATLLQHTNGVLYSTTAVGGTGNGGDGTFYSFDVGLGPFVSFLPAAGKVGNTIEFLGQGFTGTTAVFFNGTPATFSVVTDTYLKATVPAGATIGFVTVTTPGGILTSNKKFRVRP